MWGEQHEVMAGFTIRIDVNSARGVCFSSQAENRRSRTALYEAAKQFGSALSLQSSHERNIGSKPTCLIVAGDPSRYSQEQSSGRSQNVPHLFRRLRLQGVEKP